MDGSIHGCMGNATVLDSANMFAGVAVVLCVIQYPACVGVHVACKLPASEWAIFWLLSSYLFRGRCSHVHAD
jgi:hypothetical protein